MTVEEKKIEIKKLTEDILKGAYEAMLLQIDKAIESGSLPIEDWEQNRSPMLIPKIITIALLDIERDQYTAKGTSFEKFIRTHIERLKYHM